MEWLAVKRKVVPRHVSPGFGLSWAPVSETRRVQFERCGVFGLVKACSAMASSGPPFPGGSRGNLRLSCR